MGYEVLESLFATVWRWISQRPGAEARQRKHQPKRQMTHFPGWPPLLTDFVSLVWVPLSSKQITGGLVFITGDGRRANQSCWVLITGWTETAKEASSFVFLLSPHFWACDQRRACFFLVCQSSMSLFTEKVQLLFMAFWIFTRTRLFPFSVFWEPVVFLIALSGKTF